MTQQPGEFSGNFANGWYIVSTEDGSAHTATAVRAGMLTAFGTFATEAEARAFVAGFKRSMELGGGRNLDAVPPSSSDESTP